MKKLAIFSIFLIYLFGGFLMAQITDTIPAMKDATLRELGEEGDPNNYGDYAYINMHAWTNALNLVIHRSLIDFDLSSIPAGTIISSAELHLFVDTVSTLYPEGHQCLTGLNKCFIRRVVTDWDEYAVTWDTQPAITTLNQVDVRSSDYGFQDYKIIVTTLVQDMIDDPDNSFGFMIKLQHEIFYRRMVFASSNNPDQNIHPKLVVSYGTVGVKDNKEVQHDVYVYPNPGTSMVNVEFTEILKKDFVLNLFDTQGIKVMSMGHNTPGPLKIDVSELPTGTYILQIIAEDKVYAVKKILVE